MSAAVTDSGAMEREISIAMRVARIAHADMPERIEHIEPRQRAVGGDEVINE
jgi:hypothetical protein